jgi:hypothetical protein
LEFKSVMVASSETKYQKKCNQAVCFVTWLCCAISAKICPFLPDGYVPAAGLIIRFNRRQSCLCINRGGVVAKEFKGQQDRLPCFWWHTERRFMIVLLNTLLKVKHGVSWSWLVDGFLSVKRTKEL